MPDHPHGLARAVGYAVAGAGLLGVMLAAMPLLVISSMAQQPEQACVPMTGDTRTAGAAVTASTAGLAEDQLRHAGIIIAVGRERGVPAKGIVIALATALQESRLRIYANDGLGGDLAPDQQGIQASLNLPHDALGTDHGSLGIFQQQWPWWGSMQQLMDPATSAGLFYVALSRVPGWETLPVTVAAQAVQHSAYPDAYADDEPLAHRLLAQLAGTTVPVEARCGRRPGRPQVQYPLPAGSGYVDRANFGASGSRWSRGHTGTDLSVACGTSVLAATGGTVHIRTDQPWSGRWLVQITTGFGRLTTWYAHMQAVIVVDRSVVSRGQPIGEVGSEGNSSGCHLHFEVHPHGGGIYQDPIDPTRWLRKHATTPTRPHPVHASTYRSRRHLPGREDPPRGGDGWGGGRGRHRGHRPSRARR